MKPRMLVSLAMATVSLMFAASCSEISAKKKSLAQTQTSQAKKPMVVGRHYTTLIFPKGNSSLDQLNKKKLRELKARSNKSDQTIEEIKILAWADKEYPELSQEKQKPSDVTLASQRAINIKEYLEIDLKENNDIDSYNMAKRPNLLSQLFKSDEYQLKKALEESGATSTRLPDGSLSYTKASKALVIIQYKSDQDNN